MSTDTKIGTVTAPFKLVGCSFIPDYPENLHRISDEIERRQAASLGWNTEASEQTPVSLVLIRNPENEHDANAIEVHCPFLGRRASMIGHVFAQRAAKMAPLMDSGWEYEARVVSVDILPDKPEQPGLTLEIEVMKASTDTPTQGEGHG